MDKLKLSFEGCMNGARFTKDERGHTRCERKQGDERGRMKKDTMELKFVEGATDETIKDEQI